MESTFLTSMRKISTGARGQQTTKHSSYMITLTHSKRSQLREQYEFHQLRLPLNAANTESNMNFTN